MEFKDYQEYKQHVHEMCREGYINELEQDELLIQEFESIGKDGFKTINNSSPYNLRTLTEEEFKLKFYGK